MPAAHTEYRVRHVFKDHPGLIFEYGDDEWFGPGPDGAAAYPWLMNNCIVWVEQRVAYEPEPWESADIDGLPDD